MDEEKLFKKFLDDYLENVKKELPESYRAQQLKNGGVEKALVYEFETKFLKKPFMDAIHKTKLDKKKVKEEIDVVREKFGKNNLVKVAIGEIEYRLGLGG